MRTRIVSPKGYAIALALILLWASFPLLLVWLASTIAQTQGCTLNEATRHPCLLFGVDVGGTLYTMFAMGWLGLVTLPSGVAMLAVWGVGALTALASRVWNRR